MMSRESYRKFCIKYKIKLSKPFLMLSTSSFKCLVPRDVTESGNSPTFLFLNKVTFLTSRKDLLVSLVNIKSNLVLSENLTGLSRYIRSAVIPMLENIALWHERDISHSSVERILAPDVTIGLNFAINRATKLISNLKVYPENMKKNLNLLNGLVFSQALLLEL